MTNSMELRDLMRLEPGVPMARRPLFWETRMPLIVNLNLVTIMMRVYGRLIQTSSHIDEVAIMVPGPTAMDQLRGQLVEGGWDNFNQAEDLVYTNPFSTRYQVAYSFFSHPSWPWRIEVMRLASGGDKGFSPLHQSLWYPNGVEPTSGGKYPMPHLSYKVVARHDQTARRAFAQEQGRLGSQGSGLVHAQTCQSTYGSFAYWLPSNSQNQLYLKPRVNTRDEVEA